MKKIVLSLTLPFVIYAQSLPELFDALKAHSQTKSDELIVQKSKIQQDMADANLYPKIDLFANYDNYSSPTNMRPYPPNEAQTNPTQPFSYNIYKAGASFTMPLFVKSIFTTASKAEAMRKSAEAKKEINLLKNEAVIVGANANYIYLDSLLKALDLKEKSLQESKKTTQIKVDNGRAAEAQLYLINDALNQIAITKNDIGLQIKSIISTIEILTGVILQAPIVMEQKSSFTKGEIKALDPLKEKLQADMIGVKVEKEKLYPALYAHGSYAFMTGEAYNNGEDANEEYGNIGVMLNIPLLAMDNYASIRLARVEAQSSRTELEKLTDELSSEAQKLEASLPLLDNSLTLHKQSIQNKQRLLEIAKVNYNIGRLSTEEYLRYEDDVVSNKAELYKTEAIKWQTLVQLGVIYGNNIEELIK